MGIKRKVNRVSHLIFAKKGTQVPDFTEEEAKKQADQYYEQNKHKSYSQKNRNAKNSTDCSAYASGYLASLGAPVQGHNSCYYLKQDASLDNLGPNAIPESGDLLMYESKRNKGNKHVVVYAGTNDQGEHYGYESAINKFSRNGTTRNGVQMLTGIQMPKNGKESYYGIGTYREGQTKENARTDSSDLVLTGVLRSKQRIKGIPTASISTPDAPVILEPEPVSFTAKHKPVLIAKPK